MAKNQIFDSSLEEDKVKKEKDPRIVVATLYKDKRNEPVGVLIISVLSLLLGGTITGIFLFYGGMRNISIFTIDIILWVLLLGLVIYSVIFYFRNKNNPEEALFYDEKSKVFSVFNHKTKEYDDYKAEEIQIITYRGNSLYPKTSIFGPTPKKAVGDVIIITLKNNTKIRLYISDVFKTRKILSDLR